MIALTDIRPGETVTLGPTASYTVKLNSGTTMVLTRDEEDVEVTHSEARRVGMTVHREHKPNGHTIEVAY